MCYNLWYNAPTMLPATSWVHYTTSCITKSSAPEDGKNNCPKNVELIGIINKQLLFHLVGCLLFTGRIVRGSHSDFSEFQIFQVVMSFRLLNGYKRCKISQCLQFQCRTV